MFDLGLRRGGLTAIRLPSGHDGSFRAARADCYGQPGTGSLVRAAGTAAWYGQLRCNELERFA